MLKSMLFTLLSVSLFLIPAFAFMDRLKVHNPKRSALYYLFCLYLCAVYKLTGPPDITYFRWDPNITLIPFLPMIGDLRSSVLNVLLFVPLGILLPLLWERFRSIRAAVMFGLTASLAIELSQLFTFRATDVNDLITNSLGTALGYMLLGLFVKKLPTEHSGLLPVHLPVMLSFAVMFFLEPFVQQLIFRVAGY